MQHTRLGGIPSWVILVLSLKHSSNYSPRIKWNALNGLKSYPKLKVRTVTYSGPAGCGMETKHGRVARWTRKHLKQAMRMVAEWVNVRGVL